MPKQERKNENKTFRLEVKDIGDDGQVEGYLARFGNIDSYGDIIEKGAFTKTLDETKVFPLLWHHDPSEPRKVVGTFTGKQDAKGLLIKGDFLPDADAQIVRQKCTALLERGVKLGLSIGFQAIKVGFDKIKDQSVRLLQEIRLGEGSLTLFPSNPLALVTQVKSVDDSALTEEPGEEPTPGGEPQGHKNEPVEDHSLDGYAEALEVLRKFNSEVTHA